MNYSWGMNLHGQKYGGAILPDMMRWLWRDGPVSTDPNDMVERSFRAGSSNHQRAGGRGEITAGDGPPHPAIKADCGVNFSNDWMNFAC